VNSCLHEAILRVEFLPLESEAETNLFTSRYCSGKKRSVKMLVNEKAGRGRVKEGRDHHRYGVVKHASTVHPQITYMPTEKEVSR
jgi:hypothetical protein